jgi:hypothetical protein
MVEVIGVDLGSLRRQRRCEKVRPELKDQQGRQALISDPILPRMDRSPPVIDDDRMALIAIHGHEPFWHGELASSLPARFRRPQG